jgi:hypothetical protein
MIAPTNPEISTKSWPSIVILLYTKSTCARIRPSEKAMRTILRRNFFDWPIKKPSTEIREKNNPTSVVITSKYNPATPLAIGKQPGIFPAINHPKYEPAQRDSSTAYRDSNNFCGDIPKPLANARIVVN